MLILLSIIGFIVLLLMVAAVFPKAYTITSEVIINKPKDEVFNYSVHLKNQQYYNKWVMADPNVKMTYTGIDGNVGFISAWDSKNAGKGEQEIKTITNGEEYHIELRFEKPFKGISQSHVYLEALSPEQTRVKTLFETNTPFPLNLMIPLLKKMLTKDMTKTAQNLKKVLEK